ncbi:MAG: phytanoyl-CoA dioxygenase family protein [Candidatus Latescibacteria bacterium]|nr:phytanoyl-CoA dioxygenase family protein [Candidatus Latescibacterota bacterium]
MIVDKKYLLTDVEVAKFIVNGYHIVELDLPAERNESIAQQLDALNSNPGDAITETVPELHGVLDHPTTKGVLISLLGKDYEVRSHRHWHCKQPDSGHMNWHQDSTNNRDTLINRFLGLYYPRDITPNMGPTVIVPGTQFRNAPTDRMAHYTNIRGQIPLTVKAGTIAFAHYDIWHGTAANRSSVKRHMIKFLFGRNSENTEPTWNHDPDALNTPRDWNTRDKSEDPNNILTFANPLRVSQSDHYKERRIRRECWNQLMGQV